MSDEMVRISSEERTPKSWRPACCSLGPPQSTDQALATRTTCQLPNGWRFFRECRSDRHPSAGRHKQIRPAALCLLTHKCACVGGRSKLRPYPLQSEGEQFPCLTEHP